MGSPILSVLCPLLLLTTALNPMGAAGETRNNSRICDNGFCDGACCGDAGCESPCGPLMLQPKRATVHASATAAVSMSEVHTAALQVSEHLHKIASRSASPTRELLHSFRICGQCSHFERFGEPDDGGYVTCMDGLKDNLRAAYSFGVEQHDKFSADVAANFGVPVNQFDCTVPIQTAPGCSTCHFFKKCIVSDDDHENSDYAPLWTLRETLENTGQADAPKGSLLLKMDVEGAEWPVFAVAKPDVLAKFQEIIIEFHFFDQIEKHSEYLLAMQRLLDAGFQVTHLHGNNARPVMVHVEGDMIPNVLEVTLVQGVAKRQECLTEQEYLPQDHVNYPSLEELPMAKLD